MKLLYRTAEWHGLAKARMHTDSSLELLEKLTVEFGQLLRQFRDLTCSAFDTVELPGEAAARIRRRKPTEVVETPSGRTTVNLNATPTSTSATTASAPADSIPPNTASAQGSSRRTKNFNLHLFKLHSLGDYVNCIRMFGTTDSYSTQLVSHLALWKPTCNRFYVRVSWRIASSKCSMGEQTRKMP